MKNQNNNYSQFMQSFLFRRAWGEILQTLPDEKAGQMFKAIFAHTNGESVTLEDVTLNGILKSITKEIDLNSYRYLERTGHIKEDNAGE